MKDYSLLSTSAQQAEKNGLVEASWFKPNIPGENMKNLLVRSDGPALRDTALWFGFLTLAAVTSLTLIDSLWFWLPYLCYAVLYASVSDSRWHESGHGTAFKTNWLNSALYEIASFMVMRESVLWKWSHFRHHSDTIIVGRDPEIVAPRPPNFFRLFLSVFNLPVYANYFTGIVRHSFCQINAAERSFIPESAIAGLIFRARIYLLIYLIVAASAIYFNSILPLMFVGLPNFFGSWLMLLFGLSQHVGLAENVLDHRLNSRTIYMNPVSRFLYWNMNFHIEHHMFPMVPYHALEKLHHQIKQELPTPYASLLAAYREIIPTLWRQCSDPNYFVKRKLPQKPSKLIASDTEIVVPVEELEDGSLNLGSVENFAINSVTRVDWQGLSFAVYRNHEGAFFATDGMCTHGNTHLAEGLLEDKIIECPKHNGRFSIESGQALRAPACVDLRVHAISLNNNQVRLLPKSDRKTDLLKLEVLSNTAITPFMRELAFKCDNTIEWKAGDYLRFKIPSYARFHLNELRPHEKFSAHWSSFENKEYFAENDANIFTNYSIASAEGEFPLKFNIRLALPSSGNFRAGRASSWMSGLAPGDLVEAHPPLGDFHLVDNTREKIFVGGGAGMAPLRAQIRTLLLKHACKLPLTFWYGARNLDEMAYFGEFEQLAQKHENFSSTYALSNENRLSDTGIPYGFIHEVLADQYLQNHANLTQADFYLCGPPIMVSATKKLLTEEYLISEDAIYLDEF